MLSRIDRYLVREIAVPSMFALAVVSFFAVGNEIRQQVQEVLAFIHVTDILMLCVLFLPLLLSYVIPATYLLGILMAFGRLAQQGEIVAMRAAGISLKRLVIPVILFGCVLSVFGYFVQETLQPWSVKKAMNLVYTELPQRATIDVLPAGIMHEYEGWRVYFERTDPDTGTLYNVDLVRPEGEKGSTVFYAASARLHRSEEGFELVLTDGHLVTPENLRLDFETQRLRIPAPAPIQTSQIRKARDLPELFARERELALEYEEQATAGRRKTLMKERNEIAERFSLPFAAVAVSVVGAPLGLRAKRGGRSFAFTVGFAIILAYGVLNLVVLPQSLSPLLEVVLRAWVPNALLLGIGLLLVWNVDRV
ncbi:MAG: LptF/LptG family permease [Candidatus Hydrogenedentes bacterium]|nr:LptF/LptG family permease [Candidatus Hydrogenedentota bacterium]